MPQVAPTLGYEPPIDANSQPAPMTPAAVANRPTLYANPLPAARTRVGNSSGRYNGSQPKNNVETNPCAPTTHRKPGRNGSVARNMAEVSVVAPRLIRA